MTDAPADLDGGRPTRPTTALATRSPAGLRRSPAFFSTGHSEGWKILLVLLGGPAIVGGLAATVGGALGLGPALGILGVPLGMAGMNHWLESRGKSRLARARVLFRDDAAAGLQAFERVAGSGALPEVRLEAAARVAIHRLERGDIAGAIAMMSIREQDQRARRRRRNWEVGLRAEVLRAVLAWLSPNSFAESGVTTSEAIDSEGADSEGVALLAALRALERASEPEDGALSAAWSDVQGTTLEAELPTLYTVVLAVVAERFDHLLEDLHERLQSDGSGISKALLRRLFPRMQFPSEGGYRQASVDDAALGPGANLALVVPAHLQKLAELEEQDLRPVSRSSAVAAFGGTYAAFASLGVMTAALSSAPLLAGLVGGLFMALYFGSPIAVIVGARLVQERERARRVGPLLRLGVMPPKAWLTECASGPPGLVSRTSGYRRLSDLPKSQLVLYAAALRAEAALREGDLEGAWAEVEWWFEGLVGRVADPEALYAVGSSLIRIAALTGHLGQARRLLAVLPEVGNEWDSPRNRTIYGNAPYAVALVSGLVAAMEGSWAELPGFFDQARAEKVVYMAPHDHALMVECVRRSREAGVPLTWRGSSAGPSELRWARAVWPLAKEP